MSKKLFFVTAALCAPLFVSPRPTQAQSHLPTRAIHASSALIYLYVNGIPVDVTEDTSWSDGHVYDLANNLIGTVVNGLILNQSNQVIGFITIEPDRH